MAGLSSIADALDVLDAQAGLSASDPSNARFGGCKTEGIRIPKGLTLAPGVDPRRAGRDSLSFQFAECEHSMSSKPLQK